MPCIHERSPDSGLGICPQHKPRSSTLCLTTQISLPRTSCKKKIQSAPCIGPNCTNGNFAAQFGLGSNPARTQNNLKTSSMAPPVLLHKPCSPNYPSDRQNAHRCTACTHKLVRETDLDICPPHKPRSSTPCSPAQISLPRTSCKKKIQSAPCIGPNCTSGNFAAQFDPDIFQRRMICTCFPKKSWSLGILPSDTPCRNLHSYNIRRCKTRTSRRHYWDIQDP